MPVLCSYCAVEDTVQMLQFGAGVKILDGVLVSYFLLFLTWIIGLFYLEFASHWTVYVNVIEITYLNLGQFQ